MLTDDIGGMCYSLLLAVAVEASLELESREVVGSELLHHWQLRVDNIRLMVLRS